MTVGHLDELAELCAERNVMVLSDEIFSHMVYPPAVHRTIASVDGMGRPHPARRHVQQDVRDDGLPYRWTVANRELISALDIFQQNSVTNVPPSSSLRRWQR